MAALSTLFDNSGSNPSAYAFLFVFKLRKVQTEDTSIFARKMEKSGLRTAAKPLGSPIFQDNPELHKKC